MFIDLKHGTYNHTTTVGLLRCQVWYYFFYIKFEIIILKKQREFPALQNNFYPIQIACLVQKLSSILFHKLIKILSEKQYKT